MAVSKYLLAILNFITALLSIPILGAGIWLATKHSTDCIRFLQGPVIFLGVFFLLVSLAGFIGSCCNVKWLLWIYLAVMLLLIVLLFCFTIFAFVVTNKGGGTMVSGKGYREYHLGNYSSWLQTKVNKDWDRIKSCLADSKICTGIDNDYGNVTVFYSSNLDPLRSGCCKPPSACGFTYVSATNWTAPTNPGADSDCQLWNNDPSQLCFNCSSCKAGVIQNIRQDWRKVGIVNVVMLVFLIIVYSVGCCAIRNMRSNNNKQFVPGGYAQ